MNLIKFDSFGNLLRGFDWPRENSWNAPVDIHETEKELIFTSELPGFSKNEINISVNEGHLTISGERKFKGKDYHRVERNYGTFSRIFSLPEWVNQGKTSANLRDGVLTVTLAKSKETKAKQITVQ